MNVGEEEKFYPHAEVLPPTEPVSQWTITEKKQPRKGGLRTNVFENLPEIPNKATPPKNSTKLCYTPQRV